MSDRLAKLMKLHALDARDAFVLYAIAQEHTRAGDHVQALAWYDRTLQVDASYCYAYFFKARAQQALGDLTGARATAHAGQQQAHRTGDAKAAGELSTLQVELAEG
jgi:hypothetical protein